MRENFVLIYSHSRKWHRGILTRDNVLSFFVVSGRSFVAVGHDKHIALPLLLVPDLVVQEQASDMLSMPVDIASHAPLERVFFSDVLAIAWYFLSCCGHVPTVHRQ